MVQFTFNKSYFDKYSLCKIKSFYTDKELKQLKYKVKRFVNTNVKNLNGRNINFIKNKKLTLCMILVKLRKQKRMDLLKILNTGTNYRFKLLYFEY